MSENQDPSNVTPPSGNQGGGGVAQKAKKAKQFAQNMKKMAQTLKKLSMSGPLMTILFWVFVAIVAFIVLTGIIMFIVTMPGMVMDKLKALFKEIGAAVARFFGADSTQQIEPERVFETMDYIEDMGWSLKGEGFLTSYYKTGDESEINEKLESDQVEAGYNIDDEDGVVRSDEGNIILADSDFIFTYIMSDNYVYTLKNDNIATQNSASNWWDSFWAAVSTAYYKVVNFVYGPILDALGITEGMTDTWGKGLIMIYYDKGLGIKGDPQNSNLWNWDTVKIDTASKTLSIKKSSLFNSNQPMEYSLDGWTGRYGMPLEFLLTVHKATMMPDLAFDMATSFNTNVNVYLHDLTGRDANGVASNATAAYRTPDGKYITYEQVVQAKDGLSGKNWGSAFLIWISSWFETDAETIALFDLGVDIGRECGKCVIETTFYLKEGEDEYIIAKGDGKKRGSDTSKWYKQAKVTVKDDGGTETEEIKPEEYTGSFDELERIDKLTEPCDTCKKKSKKIQEILGNSNDYRFETYMPYIANVSDHWYRDVYFVLSSDTNADYNPEDYGYSKGEDIKFVDYDYDYESMVKERWTLYETYPDNSSDPIYSTINVSHDDVKNKIGEFIIYRIDDDGKYLKENGKYVVYTGSFDEARGKILYVKNDKGEYVTYEGDVNRNNGKALDKEGNETGEVLYLKDGEDKYGNATYKVFDGNTIAVAKKAVTISSGNPDSLKDVGWEQNGKNGVWTAYKEMDGATSSGWQRIYTDAEIAGDEEIEKQVKQNSYINITTFNNLVQVGEGQRTETNPEIKKMFLSNKYFRYDGSDKSAEIITELRDKLFEKRKSDSDNKNNYKYGPIDESEEEFNISKTEKDADGNDKTVKYYVKDYSGTVLIDQDSLPAFSMLENTHTLDADYIYRDFKELIVELGYFEKEELTEQIPKLLQFPIPSIGSYGYPDRTIDKRENEEGTMIHSTHDIEANKKYTLKEILKKATNAGAAAEAENGDQALVENNNRFNQPITLASSRVNNDRLALNFNPINTTEVGAVIGASKKPEQVPLQTYLKEFEEMCKKINEVGYNYCVMRIPGEGNCTCTEECINAFPSTYECTCECEEVHCHHTVHEREECGLSGTFEASQKSPTSHYDTCCNYLVRWSFQNVGISDIDENYAIGTMYNWMLKDLKGIEIKPGEPVKEGDILFYDSFGHVDVVAEVTGGGSYLKFNGGHPAEKGSKRGDMNSSIHPQSDRAPEHIVRLPWGNQNDGPYEGFVGNEAVVSPVSGILLEYGTYPIDIDQDVQPPAELPAEGEEPAEEKEERINIDLKYGPSVNANQGNKEESEDGGNGAGPAAQPEDDGIVRREWPDNVGYARILVLNKEIFEILDSTNQYKHRWRDDNDGQGLLSENGQFYDMVTTEEELKYLTDHDDDFKDETIYGFKEFTEMYEKYGIAGYYIYIDGFKCELPDPEFFDTDEDGELSDEEGNPDGEDLTFESFKNPIDNFKSDKKTIITAYEPPVEHKVASKKATEKLNVEEYIKTDTYSTLTVSHTGAYKPLEHLTELTFIKEGAVLGRTYTDKELVEERLDNNDDPKYNYEYYAPEEDPDAEEKENEDKLIGNYVMVRMSDPEKTVENVENYMKLDEVLPPPDLNYEFFFWSPYEGGAWGSYEKYVAGYNDSGTREDVGQGPTIIAVDNDPGVSWSIAVGIAQWTNNSNNLNNLARLCKYLGEFDPLLSSLADYGNKNASFFNENLQAFKDDWHAICSTQEGYNKMIEGQMTYAYEEEWLNSSNNYYKSISAWAQSRPMAVQGMIFSVMNWGNYDCPGGKLLDPVEESKDDLSLIKALAKNCRAAFGGKYKNRWDSQAQLCKDIIEGNITEEQIIEWIETKGIEGVSPGYGEETEFPGWD